MELQELGLSDIQIEALRKKKVVSVEALLRRPPLHYYDFSKTYPLTMENAETKDMLEKNRPFAIYGTCVACSIDFSNHTKLIKLRIEDEATKNHITGKTGTYLFCNIMGYDQFRQAFLSDHPESPLARTIRIPDGINAFSTFPEREIKLSCKKQIAFINSLDELSVKDFIAVKAGGTDGWSRATLAEFDDERLKSFLSIYFTDKLNVLNALRWYARGMRLDLAIKKVLLDNDSLLKKLLLGRKLLVGGFIKFDENYKTFSLLNPVALSENIGKYETYDVQYGQVKGITPERYKDIIQRGIKEISSLDFLPASVCNQLQIPAFKDSTEMMHFPKSYWHIKKSQERAVIEDLLYFALKLELSNKKNSSSNGIIMKDFSLMKKYTNSLPYDLTGDQKSCVNKICRQILQGKNVNALVQGDVGTGKTAVAFCLLLLACGSGYQSALVAPYTTLASQHYRDLKEIADQLGIKTAFLTSDVKGKDKKKALESIASGEARIIIGTHSIFSKDVEYKDLALIITDEEHKFGVVHREDFREKAIDGFHQITMSATPIPKSIATTIYDESVDVISIIEKPANRIPVQTAVCQKDITALNFMAKQIKEGHQCYVVCPSIEKNEKNDKVASIEEKEKVYRKFFEPLGISLAVVTGKLKAEEKQRIMEEYSAGNIDVLMATTVIEVGINVPNATVITITGAERFGFSTLHQLRGRVGRGKFKSYCILQTDEVNEKLQFMCTTTNGFEIAEKDLEMRGPGSLFGEKQSGDNYYVSLMLANQDLFKKLKPIAKNLCRNNTGKDIVKRYEEIFQSEEER